jgi:uncharacterized protein YggE
MATLAVRGLGVARCTPDEGFLHVQLSATHEDEAQAYDEVAQRSVALAEACERAGIPESARKTRKLAVTERFDHDLRGRERHAGYAASAVVEIWFTDPETAGRLMREIAVDVEGRVDGPHWRIARDNPARVEACGSAAADARRRAEAYADALGLRLGEVVEAAEPETRLQGARDGATNAAGVRLQPMSYRDPFVNVAPGEFEVSAAVDVSFAFEVG